MSFYLILMNGSLNVNSHMWLVAAVLGSPDRGGGHPGHRWKAAACPTEEGLLGMGVCLALRHSSILLAGVSCAVLRRGSGWG